MVGKITPVYIPRPVGILIWDGADFWAAKGDADGHLQVDALTAATGLDALLNALQSVNTDKLIVKGQDQLFSFKSGVADKSQGAPSAAGGYRESTAVPVGAIWVITQIAAFDNTTANTIHNYYLYRGGAYYDLYELRATIAIGQRSSLHSQIYMIADDTIRVMFTGSLAEDVCILAISGYSMTAE